jgi:hypothetical protein
LNAQDVAGLLRLLCEHALRIEERLPSWDSLPRGEVAALLNWIDAAAGAPSPLLARLEALERSAVDVPALVERLTALELKAAELRDTLLDVLASGRRRNKILPDSGPAAPIAPASVEGAALNNAEVGPSPVKETGENGQGELSGAVAAVDAGPGKVPGSAGPVSKVDADRAPPLELSAATTAQPSNGATISGFTASAAGLQLGVRHMAKCHEVPRPRG